MKRVVPDDQVLPKQTFYGTKYGQPRRAAEKEPTDSGFQFTTVVFMSPSQEERPMKVSEALNRGYSISLSQSRLVLRSPLSTPETYIQQVAGVPMTVLKSSTLFGKKWFASQIDAAMACPILPGSVSFTDRTVRWFLPKLLTPLLSSPQFTLLEVHLGVNGQKLDTAEMTTRGYSMTVDDVYIVVEIPIGATGGHYKSYVQDNQYLTSYFVEPMLELLWTEDVTNENTRYKVMFPIISPLIYQPPQLTDLTVPKQRVFKASIGPFASDVVLLNITFPSEVLTLDQCISRGFNIQEHRPQNDSLKLYTFNIPFTDRAVGQTKDMGHTVYSARMTFGFMVLPQFSSFSLSTLLEARLEDKVPPTVSGVCDDQNFYILVKYGTQNFQTLVGKSVLSSNLAKQYNFVENGTHFTLTVPILAADIIFEAIEASSVRSRLEVALINAEDGKRIKDLSLSCSFYSTLTECFPNGTITALALKLESVPSLQPSQLRLVDPSCGPEYSTDQYAYFVFTGNSCGTTRKFRHNVMVYENDISLPDKLLLQRLAENKDPEYHLKVTCYYDVNTTHAVAYHTSPRRGQPFADTAKGQLKVEMRMATDESFSRFYTDEDYPITKYLQEALYLEVELVTDVGGRVSLELDKCWATEDEDRTSQPRWDLIINGCVNPLNPHQVRFVPVWEDSRVRYPSQIKRFQLQMFTLTDQQQQPSHQLFIHCDVTICDPRNPMGGVCTGQCSNQPKGQRRTPEEHVSSGDRKSVV